MSDATELLEVRLRELKESFDASFAAEQEKPEPVGEIFLAVRVGGAPYALRLSEVGALEARRPITPIPSHAPELLGLSRAERGLFAVYDLSALLGDGRAKEPRWLAFAAAAPIAFAFETLEGHLRGEAAKDAAAQQRTAFSGSVHLGGEVRRVIDLRSLVSALETRVPTDEVMR